MSGDQDDAAAVPTSAAQVIEIARAVTSQVAPDELPDFDQVAAAWSSGPERRPRRARREPKVGFGFEAVLLSELLFPIITGGIGQVLGTMAVEQIRPRRPGRHVGAPRAERITSKQAHDLHSACQELAHAKLPPAEADQLADAILGTLRCADWRS